MVSAASSAIKYGSRHTRELLFEPWDAWFILRSYLFRAPNDPRSRELTRLRPYNRGTRALSTLGLLLVVPPFVMPFTAPFIGFSGIVALLAIYVVVFIAVNVLSIVVEVSLDAILAIGHERGLSFYRATKAFLAYCLASPGEATRYMGAKLIVDTLLLSVVLMLYMPAMFALIWSLGSVVREMTPGSGLSLSMATYLGFFSVIALTVAAAVISIQISVPAAAFYGYYTEEAIKHMQ